MLLKNEEIYKLTAADVKKLKAKFRKFPVIMKYAPNRIVPPSSPHNRKPDKPTSITIPFYAQRRTKMGVETWRYAEDKIVDSTGKVRYVPNDFYFTGFKVYQETDIEELWWMWNICPFVEGAPNWNGRAPKFVFEDLVGEAEKRAAQKRLISDVEALIYSPKLGLGEKELRKVAKAYFISNIDDMTLAQVQVALEKEVMKDTMSINNFLHIVKADDIIKVKAALQSAIDKKIIYFDIEKRTWFWTTEPGKRNEEILTVMPNIQPHDALFEFYKGNKIFSEQLDAALAGKSVVIPSGADDPLLADTARK